MTTDPAAPKNGPAVTEKTARSLPKVSLHCHLTGSVRAATAVELARKHGVPLPRDAGSLYDIPSYESLGEFLRVYDVIGSAMRDADDFRRVTYESLTLGGADHTVLYREIFVSPASHPGVPYATIMEGVRAGMREALTDRGIDSRVIVALHRERSAREAEALVETVIEHRTEEVVGIGLDYEEVNGPPGLFATAFRRAERAGLNRTAHSESGPPRHIEILLDDLHCTRVDHGYHVVTSPPVLRRCVDEGIAFTCTPVSSDIGRYSGGGDGSHELIDRMRRAGLRITIDSDDPPMFGTDPTNDFVVLAGALGYTARDLADFTFTAIDACWLDDSGKDGLRRRARSLLEEIS
ncbi:adenosine deaminase [Actinocorallia longicatena]|uniref:Adenosine deaminase n=1 Tax=Actinocorallia longicatena TaxID=111803 RepID=A0ABP6QFB1_9ACTN